MVKEAEDIALKEYKFSPEKILVNGTEVIDYTSAELDKIFLVNRKGILQVEKPSWIPELDVSDLRRNDFLPACVKDFSDGSYFVLNKSAAGKDAQGKETYRTDIYKMPLDILTATIDYYLKKEREQLKQNGSSAKVSLPRSRKSMTTERFDEIVGLLPLCDCYRNEPDFTKKIQKQKPHADKPCLCGAVQPSP